MRTVVAILSAASMLVAGAAFAQKAPTVPKAPKPKAAKKKSAADKAAPGPWRYRRGRRWGRRGKWRGFRRGRRFRRGLWRKLSPKQRKALRRLRMSFFQKRAHMRLQMKLKRFEMLRAMTGENPAQKLIRSRIASYLKIKQAYLQARVKHHLAVKKIVGPELAFYVDHRVLRRAFRGRRWRRWKRRRWKRRRRMLRRRRRMLRRWRRWRRMKRRRMRMRRWRMRGFRGYGRY